MNRQNEQIERFGQILREGYREQDETLSKNTQLKDIVVGFAVDRSTNIRKPRILLATGLTAAVVAAAAIILIVATASRTTALSFYIDHSMETAQAGSWIRADADEHHNIHFSDGSAISVSPKTETRIAAADSEQVIVDLNRGALKLKVTPKRNNKWTVRAGPYQVKVVGTRFSVQWQADEAVFSVQVTRGKVSVYGPGIDANGIFVAAGSQLKAEGQTNVVSVGAVPPQNAVSSEGSVCPTGSNTSSLQQKTPTKDGSTSVTDSAETTKSNRTSQPLSRTWQQLAKAKQYRQALRVAQELGVSKLAATLSADNLWLLATTARYSSSDADAIDLFVTYRKRFSTTAKSRTAAYLIAEQFFNAQGDAVRAKQWFATYLKESPNGALHEEALGHLMKTSVQLGQNTDARNYAASYLQQYPDGNFSKQAYSILAKSVVY
ncbi:MAG: FecR domain-containing protein [Deltaproteobacteria bacterium]|nr:FecR domain-containing protein [Deltaproteobacteria bacterium]MBN2670320.1 FecR domain-containing protein [Deltaproteobacteria bacterium]